MPWKETCVEEQRLKFIAAWVDEDSNWTISELCEVFGVSRKCGYKWIERYEANGLEGLRDRSRAPQSHPNETSLEAVRKLVAARKSHPDWGPRKLLVVLRQKEPKVEWPATSTAGEILKRHGLVDSRRRRRATAGLPRPALSSATEPNEVWGVDFKGWFRMGNGERCDPLTISDLFSRYLLECKRVKRPDTACARSVFERAFREYGLPQRIRSDNGVPFASTGLGGLSRLSVWWVKLGIGLERIDPGRPDQNGCHERMHRTMKRATAMPPCANGSAQQRSFNRFRWSFNHERPHEALEDNTPAQWYRGSDRQYPSRIAELEYPGQFELRQVRTNGEIKWQGEMVYLTEALIGESVGLEEVSDAHWKLWFGPIALGIFDNRSRKLLSFSPRARHQAQLRAVVENSSRPAGSFRSPQPQSTTPTE